MYISENHNIKEKDKGNYKVERLSRFTRSGKILTLSRTESLSVYL